MHIRLTQDYFMNLSLRQIRFREVDCMKEALQIILIEHQCLNILDWILLQLERIGGKYIVLME